MLTGGGEPTLHPDFNELVTWLAMLGIKIGLITNGTQSHHVRTWKAFSWVRVSINIFKGWRDAIYVPRNRMSADAALGCSFVYNGQDRDIMASTDEQQHLAKKLDEEVYVLGHPRVFVQRSVARAPKTDSCLLPYIRPCLSENAGGSVYTCWQRSQPNSGVDGLCEPGDVLDMLDGRTATVTPREECQGCLCADIVEALDAWVVGNPNGHDLFV
jgi:hypothetical protein